MVTQTVRAAHGIIFLMNFLRTKCAQNRAIFWLSKTVFLGKNTLWFSQICWRPTCRSQCWRGIKTRLFPRTPEVTRLVTHWGNLLAKCVEVPTHSKIYRQNALAMRWQNFRFATMRWECVGQIFASPKCVERILNAFSTHFQKKMGYNPGPKNQNLSADFS